MRPLSVKTVHAILAGLLSVPCLAGQGSSSCTGGDPLSEAGFVECARGATRRYQDRAAAVLDGYRRIGDDFPSMGEHWIHVGLVFDGEFDPAQPEVLTYVVVGELPVLLGVAYLLPLLEGETPPDWPAGPDAWHDHYRTLDEETLVPGHHMSGTGGEGPRLAMLHAWIWSESPSGVFAADNWAIPYLRLGLSVSDAAPAVPRALSLVSGGAEYFERVVARAQGRDADAPPGVTAAFDSALAEVGVVLDGRAGSRLDAGEEARLAGIWERLWARIGNLVDPAALDQLGHLNIP